MNKNRYKNKYIFRSDVEDEKMILAEDTEYKTSKFMECSDNHIYFYSEVDREENLMLNKEIKKLGVDLLNQKNHFGLKQVAPIKLHINSYGGVIFSGLSSVDEILKSKVPVHTIIDGCCASAATLMSVVGKKRYINKHAYMLVHQLSSGMYGTYENFKDELTNQNKLMDMIKDIYLNYTTIPEKKLNVILKHDLWLTPEECLEYGIVDEII